MRSNRLGHIVLRAAVASRRPGALAGGHGQPRRQRGGRGDEQRGRCAWLRAAATRGWPRGPEAALVGLRWTAPACLWMGTLGSELEGGARWVYGAGGGRDADKAGRSANAAGKSGFGLDDGRLFLLPEMACQQLLVGWRLRADLAAIGAGYWGGCLSAIEHRKHSRPRLRSPPSAMMGPDPAFRIPPMQQLSMLDATMRR